MTGRPCRVCSSGERAAIERDMLSLPISSISIRTGISVASINRHGANHLRRELREQRRATQPLATEDFILTAERVAQRAQEISERALRTGNDSLALRAGDAVLRANSQLADRLGVSDRNASNLIATARNFYRAAIAAMQEHPAFADAVAAQLHARGDHENAGEIQQLGTSPRKEIER